MNNFSFERLNVYQEAMKLVPMVYMLSRQFPIEERYALTSQINRAIISVPSNIAEGCGRISYKEKLHFVEIAYGSLMESYCQIQIAISLNYIAPSSLESVHPLFDSVARQLSGLRASYQRTLNPKP